MTDSDTLHARVSRRGRRWRRMNGVLSAGIGVVAIGAAVSLGLTAPATSPVQPAAPAAIASPSTPATGGAAAAGGAGAVTGTGTPIGGAPSTVDRGRGGDHGHGDRAHTVAFDGHHR